MDPDLRQWIDAVEHWMNDVHRWAKQVGMEDDFIGIRDLDMPPKAEDYLT